MRNLTREEALLILNLLKLNEAVGTLDHPGSCACEICEQYNEVGEVPHTVFVSLTTLTSSVLGR
jgi:hypothetical protein